VFSMYSEQESNRVIRPQRIGSCRRNLAFALPAQFATTSEPFNARDISFLATAAFDV